MQNALGRTESLLSKSQIGLKAAEVGPRVDATGLTMHFLVSARDKLNLKQKIAELSVLGLPYLIVCGEQVDLPGVVYRPPKGKYDAINFGLSLIPQNVDVVVFNDVDTRIRRFGNAVSEFKKKNASLLFAKVIVKGGPQSLFYLIQDKIRKFLLIVADGELMLVRRKSLDRILPIRRCKAEDTYILFSILERKEKAIFCESCQCITARTGTLEEEEAYKRRTVAGVYQALSYTNPPPTIKLFYILLPFVSPILLVLGGRGRSWMKGILTGFVDYLRGDRTGTWKPGYARSNTI